VGPLPGCFMEPQHDITEWPVGGFKFIPRSM
jgi:hypothetical protein